MDPKIDNTPITAQQKSGSGKTIALIVGALALVVVAAIVVMVVSLNNKADDDKKTADKATDKIVNGTDWEAYKSSEHGFTVDFPGFPSTKSQNLDVEGVPVPLTQYVKDLDNGSKAYIAQVAKYPKDQLDITANIRGALDGSINGSAQGDDSTITDSENSSEFLGYPAATATVQNTQSSEPITIYTLSFVKGNDLYTLMTAGVSKPDFDRFTKSFKFDN